MRSGGQKSERSNGNDDRRFRKYFHVRGVTWWTFGQNAGGMRVRLLPFCMVKI
jgi:hypothetical protein